MPKFTVELFEEYRDGLELLAVYHGTTVDGIVGSLVYNGLRAALTSEVIESGLAKQRGHLERQFKIGDYDPRKE